MKRIAVAVAMAALLGGCVSQTKYEALETTLKKAKADHAAALELKAKEMKEAEGKCKAELAKKEAKIGELNKKITALEAELTSLKQLGEQQQGQIGKLTTQLTKVVKDRTRLRASANELKKALAEMGKRKAEADRRVKQFLDLLARFKKLIDAGKLKVKIADGRMVLALPTDVLFASGKAKLSDAGKAAVTEVTAVLVTLHKRRFQVEGHTDNVPIKTSRYPSNWELSAARALGVVKTMLDAAMPGDRVSAAGFGEFRPVAKNDTDVGKTSNRRIEIVLVPDLSSLPGFSELKKAMGDKK